MNAAARASSARSRVASQPIRRPASANDFDRTPSEIAALEPVGAGGQPVGLVEFEEAVDLVGQEVDAGLAAQLGQGPPVGLRVGSIPVGLCGALTITSRVYGRRLARSRSTSSAQPSASNSSWRVTSAPADRATSYRLW